MVRNWGLLPLNGVREPPCKQPLCSQTGIQMTAASADTLTTTTKQTLRQTYPAQPLLNFQPTITVRLKQRFVVLKYSMRGLLVM